MTAPREWYIRFDSLKLYVSVWTNEPLVEHPQQEVIHVVERRALSAALKEVGMLRARLNAIAISEATKAAPNTGVALQLTGASLDQALSENAKLREENASALAMLEKMAGALGRIDEHVFESENDRDVIIECVRESLAEYRREFGEKKL